MLGIGYSHSIFLGRKQLASERGTAGWFAGHFATVRRRRNLGRGEEHRCKRLWVEMRAELFAKKRLDTVDNCSIFWSIHFYIQEGHGQGPGLTLPLINKCSDKVTYLYGVSTMQRIGEFSSHNAKLTLVFLSDIYPIPLSEEQHRAAVNTFVLGAKWQAPQSPITSH